MKAIVISPVIFSTTCHTIAVTAFVSRVCQDTFGNYTANSTFKNNLNTFFSIIENDTKINYGFYNFSVGQGVDTVNGLGICRPDLTVSDCRKCLSNGAAEIVVQCPNQKDAIGWYEQCMIRYSDRYIFGKLEFSPWYNQNSPQIFIDKKRFNSTSANLLAKLQKEAAGSNDSRYKFAAEEVKFSNTPVTLYALVQCTPDLEQYDCYTCLDQAVSFSLSYAYGKKARVFYTSCNIRYEDYPFYNQTNLKALQRPHLPPFKSEGRKHGMSKLKILLVILVLYNGELYAAFGKDESLLKKNLLILSKLVGP